MPPTSSASILAVSTLAHAGAGFINTWGFAYVGGVIGLFGTSLSYVHHTVSIRGSSPQPSRPSRLLRAIVPLGMVCGVSIGFGSARVLESVLDAAPTTSELIQQICVAAAADSAGAFDTIHHDISHYASDRPDATVVQAHTDLDRAIAVNHDGLTAEITQLIAAIETADPGAAVPTCLALTAE